MWGKVAKIVLCLVALLITVFLILTGDEIHVDGVPRAACEGLLESHVCFH